MMNPNFLIWLYTLMTVLLIAMIPVVIILTVVGYVAKKTKTSLRKITKY
jgi:hypothetical protein